MARRHLKTAEFTDIVRNAFGRASHLRRAERLRGGTRKGVYRLTLDDATSIVVYVWNDEEDYWPQQTGQDSADQSGHSAGIDLFEAAHVELSRLGVGVPEVLLLDRSRTLIDGDVALVEDVRGGTLETLCRCDPQRAQPVLRRLGDAVETMHNHRRGWYGRPGTDHAPAPGQTAELTLLERALGDLEESAAKVPRIAAVRQRLADVLHERFAAVSARRRHGLIHGELGPDHVLVDDHDKPVLIDIEGTRFFDAEWEHVFLELRFGDDYRYLNIEDLDGDRLRLYRPAMYLSLVAGPLRLLDGDFPDRAGMLGIVEHNINRTLGQL